MQHNFYDKRVTYIGEKYKGRQGKVGYRYWDKGKWRVGVHWDTILGDNNYPPYYNDESEIKYDSSEPIIEEKE